MYKKIWRLLRGNPLDRLLRVAQKRGAKRVLIAWNRGLGDIPLGLYALTERIRSFLPEAEITYLTRADLREGFSFLQGVRAIAAPTWKRGKEVDLSATLQELSIDASSFDLILEKPNPTQWLGAERGSLVPRLQWKAEWDERWKEFPHLQGKECIGVHVQTETHYGYEKNWPLERWKELFAQIHATHKKTILLFGFQKSPPIAMEGVIDLRGDTDLFTLLSIVKNCCRTLIVPDSGVLAYAYYLDVSFPLRIVSLWSDPRQGVLKQNVSSPNPLLEHCPLIGREENITKISVEEVLCAL